MSDDVLSFEEHRRRRDEDPDLVRCARCGRTILATVTRCPECHGHFQGEAYDFTCPSERDAGGRRRRWVLVVAVLLLAALLLSAIGVW
jgi:hypothetical protein